MALTEKPESGRLWASEIGALWGVGDWGGVWQFVICGSLAIMVSAVVRDWIVPVCVQRCEEVP